MIGFINLNKSRGMTSHDCVAKIRKLLQIKRVGHGGTLDPAATGVLPIAVGKATRLLTLLPEKKVYRALIRLGMQTTTDDLEGEVISTQSVRGITPELVETHLARFVGKIDQIPPAYSAIKQGGKPLYERARKGEVIEVPSRQVDVYQIELLNWYLAEFFEVEINLVCGGGTYIRAIARDLGNSLKTGGTLARLERLESCGMNISNSITLEKMEQQLQTQSFNVIDPQIVLSHLPSLILSHKRSQKWCHGQQIQHISGKSSVMATKHPQKVRVNHKKGKFLGIGEVLEQNNRDFLVPKIVL